MGVGPSRELGEPDIRAMLDFVGELNSLEHPETFRAAVLPGIRELVPCEIATYNEVDFPGASMIAIEDPVGSLSEGAVDVFVRHGRQNPLVERYERTRDGRPYMWSDLITRRDLHRTDLYRDAYAAMSVEYQLAFCLPAPPELIIAFALNRSRRDFSERDRSVLNMIRAPMIQALRRAERYAALNARLVALERGLEQRGAGVVLLEQGAGGERFIGFASAEAERSLGLGEGGSDRDLPERIRSWLATADTSPAGTPPAPLVVRGDGSLRVAVHMLPARDDGHDALLVEPVGEMLAMETLRASGLTQREAEVMRLVAIGHSNAAIAAELVISARTVHKHLQNAYDKLGAASRTQAVQAAWSISRPAPLDRPESLTAS